MIPSRLRLLINHGLSSMGHFSGIDGGSQVSCRPASSCSASEVALVY